jgi:RNase P subunit RPR2
MKTCSKCKKSLGEENFYKNKLGKNGLTPWCKKCNHKNASFNSKKLRLAVMAYLGNKCVKCGFTDLRALQIDHVNGGGNIERKKISWYLIYKKILSGKYDSEYQILCSNCNQIKRIEKKEFGNQFKNL